MFALMALLPWAINSAAGRCAPVPQSKIRRSPLAVVSSTQEVLPPKWFVPGPGVAIDPLVPQKRTLMGLRLPCVRHRPLGNSIPLFSACPANYGGRCGASILPQSMHFHALMCSVIAVVPYFARRPLGCQISQVELEATERERVLGDHLRQRGKIRRVYLAT